MYGHEAGRSTRPTTQRVPPHPRPPHRPDDSRTRIAAPCARDQKHPRPERVHGDHGHIGMYRTGRSLPDLTSVPGRGPPDCRASRPPHAADVPPLEQRRGQTRRCQPDRTRGRSKGRQPRFRAPWARTSWQSDRAVMTEPPERIQGATGVGRRGLEPLASCVSNSAEGPTDIHGRPGKPSLTCEDGPRSSPAHQPHPRPSAIRFLSIFLPNGRPGHRPSSHSRCLCKTAVPIADPCVAGRPRLLRRRQPSQTQRRERCGPTSPS